MDSVDPIVKSMTSKQMPRQHRKSKIQEGDCQEGGGVDGNGKEIREDVERELSGYILSVYKIIIKKAAHL